MNIQIVKTPVSIKDVEKIGQEFYKTMIKGVVDIKREIIALGGEYHIDSNLVLISDGSKQEDVWGFNILFNKDKKDRLQFNSLINIRPNQDNYSLEIKNSEICDKIKKIVNNLVI